MTCCPKHVGEGGPRFKRSDHVLWCCEPQAGRNNNCSYCITSYYAVKLRCDYLWMSLFCCEIKLNVAAVRLDCQFSWCGGPPLCMLLSVDVAGFSLGSSYTDKHEQPNCCAVARHAAVWGLFSEHLWEESKKYITKCVCVYVCAMSEPVCTCSPVCLRKPLAGLF